MSDNQPRSDINLDVSQTYSGEYLPVEVEHIHVKTIPSPDPKRSVVAYELRYMREGDEIEVSDEIGNAVSTAWFGLVSPLVESWIVTYGAVYNFSVLCDRQGRFQVSKQGFSIVVHEQLWKAFHSTNSATSREIICQFKQVADPKILRILDDDLFELNTASRCYRQHCEVESLIPRFLNDLRLRINGISIH